MAELWTVTLSYIMILSKTVCLLLCVLYAGGAVVYFLLWHSEYVDLQSSKLQKLEVASGRRGVSSCNLLSRMMAFVLLCSSRSDLHPPAADDSLGSKSSRLEPPIRDHESVDVLSNAERKSNPQRMPPLGG